MLHRGTSKVLQVSAALAIVAAPMAWATSSASASGVFSNTASIGLQNPTSSSAQAATVYPSTISVSGQSGTISSVAVTLSGINYTFSQDIGALLVGPTGRALSLFTAVGSNTQSTATSGLNVTLDDSASQTFPYNTALPTSGSVTMKPDDISTDFAGFSYDQYPSPAPTSFGEAAPTGTATLGSTFDGTNPNGTWSLYVTTNTEGDGTGSISGGWSLDITTAPTLSATTTSLTSSQNPSFTSAPDSSVTLTATVTSSGGPVTSGTVDFTGGGTTISGCGAVALNGSGRATCTTSFSGEGDHALQAVYSGTASFAVSEASTTQEVDNHTTVVAPNEFANSGAVALNNPTSSSPQPATPYPSRIYTSDLGPVTGLTVTLDGVSYPFSQDLDALLVGPTGRSIVLLSNVGPSSGTTRASDVTVTFDDAATSAIPQATPLGSPGSSVTTKPVDYVGTDTDSFAAPAPDGPYGTPAPKGSATFGGTFDGTNPNGTWSLYVVTDGEGDGTGSVAGGWSIDFAVANQTVSFSSTAPTTAGAGSTYAASASATSTLPVSYSIDASSTPGACSVSSIGLVSFLALGKCVVDGNQNGDGNYNPAPQAQQTINIVSLPGAPTALAATAGNAQVGLSWAAPASDGGSAVSSYNIYEGTTSGGETLLTSTRTTATSYTATSYTATGLTNGTKYYFEVTAVNGVGEGPVSNEASAAPASPPTPSPIPTTTTTTTPTYTLLGLAFPDANLTYPNGAIVNFAGTDYVFAGGRAFGIAPKLLAAVQRVDHARVLSAPAGAAPPTTKTPRAGTVMFTGPVTGNPTVYVVGTDGKLHGFSTPTQFSDNGYDTALVVTVPSLGGLIIGSSAGAEGTAATALATSSDGAIVDSSGTFYVFAGGKAFGISEQADLVAVRKADKAVVLHGSVRTAQTRAAVGDGALLSSLSSPSGVYISYGDSLYPFETMAQLANDGYSGTAAVTAPGTGGLQVVFPYSGS